MRADDYSVLISVPHGAAAGNMLRTGIVRRVLDAYARDSVWVWSPMASDPDFVRELGVKVTCLHEGAVLSEGTLDFVSSDERVMEVYLGR